MSILHRRIACRRAVELMADYLDDALTGRDRSRLEHHLHGCPRCREYLAQLRAAIDAAGAIPETEPSDVDPATLEDLVAVYRRWRDGAPGPEPPTPA